ncbi:MAG: 50S ribosomal protein L18 [Rhodospirillales bacterium]|nr:50S ribosomal protein L18 [Alphaproteobacteria bacterium]MCB9986472.1 50S ribosomal protein L18 [Rhodospirillales bacterium]USO06983.1 MAG: 50S ribosomal protein L18 [Rhodospirillales bacterium]
MKKAKTNSVQRRQFRNRNKVRALALKGARPRLNVFRSASNIYAQIIDDTKGVTLAAASTVDKEVKASAKLGGNVAAATEVGKLIAARAKKAGVKQVVFDRGSYLYHGRVKALAEAAREGGLEF